MGGEEGECGGYWGGGKSWAKGAVVGGGGEASVAAEAGAVGFIK